MGTSSCCSSSPPPEKKNVPHVMTINQNTTNTTRKPQKESDKDNSSEEESLKLSENQIEEMVDGFQLFLSFLQSMTAQAQKVTIGQGGQGKIRKYFSNKYQREVVEKIVNLNNCTRGTLGISGIQSLIKEAVLLAGFDHLI